MSLYFILQYTYSSRNTNTRGEKHGNAREETDSRPATEQKQQRATSAKNAGAESIGICKWLPNTRDEICQNVFMISNAPSHFVDGRRGDVYVRPDEPT